MDIERVRERIEKLERLATGTHSEEERKSALRMVEALRSRYLVPEQAENMAKNCECVHSHDLALLGLTSRQFRVILSNLESISRMPFSDEGQIVWKADISVSPFLFFFLRKSIDIHISFSSCSLFALGEMINTFNEFCHAKGFV